MKSLFELGSRFFSRPVQTSVRISGGAAYDSQNVNKLQVLQLTHNFKFINGNDKAIWRGLSTEAVLGSAYPGLGISTMRPGFARYLKSLGHTCVEDLSPEQKRELKTAHVNGYSLMKGNTKIAHSFSYNEMVALGFGIDAAHKSSNFPEYSLLAVARTAFEAWDVDYDPLTLDGEHQGTSIFSYQSETIVPYLITPPDHCIVVNQKQQGLLHLDELKQAKRFDAASFELSTITPETIRKYQQLEIDKVIAYDDYIQQVSKTGNPEDPKALEFYEQYQRLLIEQSTLVNMSHCEREQWVCVANTVAPKTYSCIYADKDGFTVELPKKDGGLLVEKISNFEAKVLFSPLFEADHTLTLDKIKSGEVPSALNYLTESVIRKNKDLVCKNGLEKCVVEEVEEEQNQDQDQNKNSI